MKLIRLPMAILALSILLWSCSKSGDDDEACMDNHITTVIFKNTGSMPLRVEVASQLTPQYEAVNPVVREDIAPGASIKKDFTSGRYSVIWKSGCPSNCNVATSAYSRDFEDCEEYEEARGI